MVDIAKMIVDIADKTTMENASQVFLSFYDKFEYVINIVPMTTHIFVKYRTLIYKVPRSNKAAYDEICEFLAEELRDSLATAIKLEMEFGNLDHESVDDFDLNTISIICRHETVFSKIIKDFDKPVFLQYMRSLFYT